MMFEQYLKDKYQKFGDKSISFDKFLQDSSVKDWIHFGDAFALATQVEDLKQINKIFKHKF